MRKKAFRPAIISTFLGQKTSGGEISAFLLAKSLSERAGAFAITAKITERMPFKAYSIPLLRHAPNMLLLIGNPLFDWIMEKRIRRILQSEKPGIVHIQDPSMMIAGYKAAKRLGIPCVMTVRDYRFVCNLSTCLEQNRIERGCGIGKYARCMRSSMEVSGRSRMLAALGLPLFFLQRQRLIRHFGRMDFYISVSDFIRNELVKSGIHAGRISTIIVQKEDWHASAPSHGSGKRDRQPVIFSAGGLKETKGFDTLIRAFASISKNAPGARLRIAGSGSARRRLGLLAESLGVAGKIDFLGTIARDDIRKEYGNCAFSVSPSSWPEPLTRIIHESFSAGRTIVATDVGGTSELVKDNITGLLVRPRDWKEMGEAMLRLIKDYRLRKRLERNAYRLISRVASEKVNFMEHVKVYRKALAEKA